MDLVEPKVIVEDAQQCLLTQQGWVQLDICVQTPLLKQVAADGLDFVRWAAGHSR